MKTLIEIHALQNFAPSNLNRDDTGAPKDAFFGGTRRARLSSQCVKRAVRQHFRDLVNKGTLTSNDIAVRTKRMLDALTKSLLEKGRGEEEAKEKIKSVLGAMGLKVKQEEKTEYLLFLGQQEIDKIANIINEKWETITTSEKEPTDEKKQGKGKKKVVQNADPALKEVLNKVFNGGKAVDVAMFGRMLADMPEKNQDAACQVAHAISTHAVEREFDFYTAVDDLKSEDTSGADMMGTIEFNSACFYRYAVVDWMKLVKNLQKDEELARKALRAFLEGFIVSEPTGKQNTFAAHNPPEFVFISVRHNTFPRNLANAFETAIRVRKDESITKESATKLIEKAKLLEKAYGGKGKTIVLNLVGVDLTDFGSKVDSLEELLSTTKTALQN